MPRPSRGAMPSVSYKLKADPAYSTLEFEGDSISAARLRQEIIDQKLKGNAGAMGLSLTNTQSGAGAWRESR